MSEKPENGQGDEPIAEEVPPGDIDLVLETSDVSVKAPVRRQLGVKEPIVFKWKLVGTSGDVILTLFKAVEREEVEAQLDRVRKDGYYTDLRILENDVKIVQPKPQKVKAARSVKKAVDESPTAKAAKAPTSKADTAKRVKPSQKSRPAPAQTRASTTKTRTEGAKAAGSAAAGKSAGKNAARVKTPAKRSAKKK